MNYLHAWYSNPVALRSLSWKLGSVDARKHPDMTESNPGFQKMNPRCKAPHSSHGPPHTSTFLQAKGRRKCSCESTSMHYAKLSSTYGRQTERARDNRSEVVVRFDGARVQSLFTLFLPRGPKTSTIGRGKARKKLGYLRAGTLVCLHNLRQGRAGHLCPNAARWALDLTAA